MTSRNVDQSRSEKSSSALSTEEAPTPPKRRKSKARSRTRAKLLRAAREVMGKKGIDTIAISEITEEAELSLGSFYNYFSSKEEIARAVFVDDALALADLLDSEPHNDLPIAERVGINIRRTLRYSLNDSVWGWFFIHSSYSINDMMSTLGSRLSRDVRLGIEDGSFAEIEVDSTVDCIMGGLVYVLRQILEGNRPASAVEQVAEYTLRGLGISPEEASRIVSLPLNQTRDREETRQKPF